MEVIATTPAPRRPGLPEPDCQGTAARDKALLTLGLELKHSGYRFTAVTPATHARVNARVNVRQPTLPPTREDIFGWSRCFGRGDLSRRHVELLAAAGELAQSGPTLRSRVRFSTLANQLFVHSAYPTDDADAVFFGPDTYRFARLIRQALPKLRRPSRLLDIGSGSGAGGLFAATLQPNALASLVLSDINTRALRFSRINALINKVENVETRESNLFESIGEIFDLIIANPPYLFDPRKRMYRHGGGLLGSELTVQIVSQSLEHLAPGGRLVVYSGSPITRGVDQLENSIGRLLTNSNFQFEYEEIDPDVFGEELDRRPYDRVDRIAAIGITVDRVH